jgi:signal transduction protein with GAF and PtsI domain
MTRMENTNWTGETLPASFALCAWNFAPRMTEQAERLVPSMRFPNAEHWADHDFEISFLQEIAKHMSLALPLHDLLKHVMAFATAVIKCDSCFIYVLEGDELVLRASKNPHPEMVDRLKLKVGEGITGWVAEHREPVAVAMNAAEDPRFKAFNDLPEDYFEAFLSVPLVSRGRVVGVINLQNRKPHQYNRREIGLISTIGTLVGAEIEMARFESERSKLSDQLEIRNIVERAKGILQRSLGINEIGADLILQEQSRQRGKSIREIAESLVLSEDLKQKT